MCFHLITCLYIHLCTCSTTPAKKYNSRTNKGDVVASIGSTSNVQWHGSAQEVTIETYTKQNISKDFKYMFQKMSDKKDGKVFFIII